MPLDLQFYTLFVMVVTGIAAGFTFDVFRVMRGLTGVRGIAGDLLDLLFWVVVTALVSMGLVVGNWGDLRLSVLLGGLVGVWMYVELASDTITYVLSASFKFVAQVVRFLYEWTVNIIVFPFSLAFTLLMWALEIVGGLLGLGFRFIAWLFAPLVWWMYPHIEPKIGFYRHRIGPYWHWLKQFLR